MKFRYNVKISWKIFLISILILIGFSGEVAGQVTYRATEDALKQLIKDIEALRKAPASGAAAVGTLDGTAGRSEKGLLGGTYTTKRGDTLNQIINSQISGLPLKMNIVRLAIVKANPHAFKRSNPNWMYAGKRLKLPSVDDIRSVVFKADSGRKKRFSSDPDSWIKYP